MGLIIACNRAKARQVNIVEAYMNKFQPVRAA
jgi:hypothetical protein